MERIKIKKLNISEKKEFSKLFKDAPKKNFEKFDFYGAYDGYKLVGGIVIDPKPDHFHYRGLGLYPEAIGDYIGVLKEYRNQGVGKRLIDILLKHKFFGFRTGGMTSDIAMDIYKKLGFKVVRDKGLVKYWYYEK